MRKKIAAANWKMNLTWQAGEELLDTILKNNPALPAGKEVLLAMPFPYLSEALKKTQGVSGISVAAQNCHHLESGAYTGEVAAAMLASIGIRFCVIGHSERREYQAETHEQLAQKMRLCFQHGITPIFCCGEPLSVREAATQNEFVKKQLEESLFQLETDQVARVIVAYEPIWAIGTGQTATAEQAQEMHAFVRSVIAGQYGEAIANKISILYGGSVKASNATSIFSGKDVDGGLVGGASLVASEFQAIIDAL